MPLVYAGVISHGPGMTGRAHLVENIEARDQLYAALAAQSQAIKDSGAEVMVVVAAEHFANFFMDNMPAYCIGLGERHQGPIEDPEWLRIPKVEIPGAPDLAKRLTTDIMQTVDVAYAEEWKFDHGIMVPLHFLTPEYDLPIIPVNINCQGPPLTPLSRAWAFGEALGKACAAADEAIAVIGTGGISHWPATPDSGGPCRVTQVRHRPTPSSSRRLSRTRGLLRDPERHDVSRQSHSRRKDLPTPIGHAIGPHSGHADV